MSIRTTIHQLLFFYMFFDEGYGKSFTFKLLKCVFDFEIRYLNLFRNSCFDLVATKGRAGDISGNTVGRYEVTQKHARWLLCA